MRNSRSATARAPTISPSLSRYEQFLVRRLRDAGQYKRANEILSKHVATFSTKGKGRLFGLNHGFCRWRDPQRRHQQGGGLCRTQPNLACGGQALAELPDLWRKLAGLRRGGRCARCRSARALCGRGGQLPQGCPVLHEHPEICCAMGEQTGGRRAGTRRRLGALRWRGGSRSSRAGSARAKPTFVVRCSTVSASPASTMSILPACSAFWSTSCRNKAAIRMPSSCSAR